MFLALVSLWDRPPPPPTTTLIREAEGANERERDPFCTLPFVTSEIRARGRGSAVGPTVKHLFRLLIHSGSSLSHGGLTQSSFCPSLHSHSLGDSRLWQNWTKSSIASPNERGEKGAVAAAGSLLFHRPAPARWPKQADYKMRAHVQGRGRLTDNQTLSELRRKW